MISSPYICAFMFRPLCVHFQTFVRSCSEFRAFFDVFRLWDFERTRPPRAFIAGLNNLILSATSTRAFNSTHISLWYLEQTNLWAATITTFFVNSSAHILLSFVLIRVVFLTNHWEKGNFFHSRYTCFYDNNFVSHYETVETKQLLRRFTNLQREIAVLALKKWLLK